MMNKDDTRKELERMRASMGWKLLMEQIDRDVNDMIVCAISHMTSIGNEEEYAKQRLLAERIQESKRLQTTLDDMIAAHQGAVEVQASL